MKLISYAAKSDQGPYFNINEDGHDLDFSNSLYLIIDGFGGPGNGDQCVKKLKDNIKVFYTKIGGDPDATMPFYYSSKYLIEGNALINAFHVAHKTIFKDNNQKDLSNRAGASVLAVAESENLMTVVSTGNCLCYLIRKGKIKKIMVEDGPELLSHDDYDLSTKTCPLSGIGLFEEIHLQIKELRIIEGDVLLLMTDGAYGRIRKHEIKQTVEENPDNLMKAVDSVFDTVNSRGNIDNQSMIILKY